MRTDPTVNGGAAFYYGHDHEGSVTHLINASGDVIESYQYDAFGAVRRMWDRNGRIDHTTLNNRFLFTGREYAATYQGTYVPAFNFYEYRARAYQPGLGRFMSEDHKLADTGDYNLFRYCHNDPINHTDPMGLTSLHAMGHPTPERMKAMIDEAYNKAMADAQRTMHGAHGGATDIGRGGYNAWTARGGLHIAQVTKGTANAPQFKEYPTWQTAGDTQVKQAYSAMQADEYTREYTFEIGQRQDAKSGHYIATDPHAGPGPGHVPDRKGFFQRGTIDPSRIPPGYRMVGFGFAQVRYAQGFNADDMARADRRHWVAVLATPPRPGEARTAPYIYHYPVNDF